MDEVDRALLLQVQDNTSQWGQGTIRDRSEERLTRSDTGLRLLRRIWDRELRNFEATGECTEWVVKERLALAADYHG